MTLMRILVMIVLMCCCYVVAGEGPRRELVVVSWNVLADASEREVRLPALLDVLRAACPDVIAVQEVTPWFSAALAAAPWASDLKRVSGDADQPFPGGLALFTHLPLLRQQVVHLPTAMGRCGIVIEVASPGGPLSFAVVHLDSYLEDGPMRARQLRTMATALQGREQVVFLGDFNFGDGAEETAALPAGLLDLWPTMHLNDPGFTWDIARSPMAKRGSFPGEHSRRLDRVLLRSAYWRPNAMNLLGSDPVANTGGLVFPSDHFGVRVVLSAP